jgi:flagellar biosynthesis/type III secretory pathway M-ring protein FliF/YscJ
MEVRNPMKKLVTMFFALAVALSLSVPVFAKHHEKKAKAAAASAEQDQAHAKHAKQKGATEGKKEGQQETAPAPKK